MKFSKQEITIIKARMTEQWAKYCLGSSVTLECYLKANFKTVLRNIRDRRKHESPDYPLSCNDPKNTNYSF